MHTFQDFAGGLLMNPCINIYDPVMTNLTHNFSLASPVYQPNPPPGKTQLANILLIPSSHRLPSISIAPYSIAKFDHTQQHFNYP